VILATHDPQVLKAVGHRIITMEKGRIISDDIKHKSKV